MSLALKRVPRSLAGQACAKFIKNFSMGILIPTTDRRVLIRTMEVIPINLGKGVYRFYHDRKDFDVLDSSSLSLALYACMSHAVMVFLRLKIPGHSIRICVHRNT